MMTCARDLMRAGVAGAMLAAAGLPALAEPPQTDRGQRIEISRDALGGFERRPGQTLLPADKPGRQSRPLSFDGSAAPNDPDLVNQWYLDGTGQYGSTPGMDIGAIEAWQQTPGSARNIIAVLATGIDYRHEDLAPNLWQNPGEIPGNRIDDDQNGYVDDVYGIDPLGRDSDPMDPDFLGTAMAGIAAAAGNNGVGIAGVDQRAKILSCRFLELTESGGYYFKTDLVECLEYVIRTRKKSGANIVAVVLPFSDSTLRNYLRPLVEELDELDILVVAPSPQETLFDMDLYPMYPLGFDVPNVLAVGPLRRDGFPSGYYRGSRIVHTLSFAEQILTTFPGYDPSFGPGDIYYEGFEDGSAWTYGQDWVSTTVDAYSGARSASIQQTTGSPSDERHLTSPSIDLGDYRNKPLGVSLKVRVPDLHGAEIPGGSLAIEIYYAPEDRWEYLYYYFADESQNWRTFSLTIPSWHWLRLGDASDVRFRIVYEPFEIGTPELYIDDFAIGIVPPSSPTSNRYAFIDGPPAAASIVAGMASLIRADDPTLSASQVKNLIVATGTTAPVTEMFPEEDHSSLHNRYARLWGPGGSGAMNCIDADVATRVLPRIHRKLPVASGQELLIRRLSSSCGGSVPANDYLPSDGSGPVVMHDDGEGPDIRADDGNHAAAWRAADPGDVTLVTPDDTDIVASVLDSYGSAEVPFVWRDLGDAPQLLTYDLEVPFPFRIGNHPTGISDIYVMEDKGRIYVNHLEIDDQLTPSESEADTQSYSPSGSLVDYDPAIPAFYDSFFITPFSAPRLQTMDRRIPELYAKVFGTAPNREWVIEWRNVTHWECHGEQVFSFQVTFSESSSDIVASYQGAAPICGDPARQPVAGIQYNETAWATYRGEIGGNMTVRFSAARDGSNRAPELVAPIPFQLIDHGTSITLDLDTYFDDPDGDALTYYLADMPPTFSIDSNGILTGRLSILDELAELRHARIYAHDGELATRAYVSVKNRLNSNWSPEQLQPIPQQTIYVGIGFEIDLAQYFTDRDDDRLAYILQSAPDYMRITDEGVLTGGLAWQAGTETVEFVVSDGRGYKRADLIVEVLPSSQSSSLAPKTGDAAGSLQVDAGPRDSSSGAGSMSLPVIAALLLWALSAHRLRATPARTRRIAR